MMQQIENLTKTLSLMQSELEIIKGVNSKEVLASKLVATQSIYYIESGEVTIDRKTKKAKATLMFGLGDLLTVETTYVDVSGVLDAVLSAVQKIRPTAQYYNKNTITIKENTSSLSATGTASSEVDSYQNKLKFKSDLANCTPRKSYQKKSDSYGLFMPAEDYVIIGKSNGKCKIKYTFTDASTNKTAHKVTGYCTFDAKTNGSNDVLVGDNLVVASMIPYITTLNKKSESKRSKMEQSIYDFFTHGEYEEFMQIVEEKNYDSILKCKVKKS